MLPSDMDTPVTTPPMVDERDFQIFFEMANVGNVIAEPITGRFLRVNHRFCDITGYTEEELSRLTSFDLTHPDDLQADLEGWEKVIRSDNPSFSIEKRYRCKDGRIAWVNVTSTLVRDNVGRPLRAIGVVRDVTDRRLATDELAKTRAELEARVTQRTAELTATTLDAKETAQYFQALIQNSPLPILSIDLQYRVRLWNPEAERLFGWKAEEVIGQPLPILPEANRAQYEAELEAMAYNRTPWQYETQRQCRDGTLLQVVIWRAPLFDAEHRLYASMAILMDITHRKMLEQTVLQATERESRRIGQELHDHLCQHLLGAAFSAKALSMKLAPGSEAATELGHLARLINSSVQQTRDIARGLNPVEINRAGLVSALEELVSRPLPGIVCRLECSQPIMLPGSDAALNVYRIAQEAVANAARHSGCTEIEVRLSEDEHEIRLEICDNGKGMPANRAENLGSGLKIMELRAAVLSGKIFLDTANGPGTRVTCVLPKPR